MTEAIELNWKPTTYIDNTPCRLAPIENGWLIVSVGNPRFCFYAHTEAAAIATAERAMRFYREGRKSVKPPGGAS